MRRFLAALPLLVFSVPIGDAYVPFVLTAFVEAELPEESAAIEVPRDDRGVDQLLLDIRIHLEGREFVCAQDTPLSVEILVDRPANATWAGGSVNPSQLDFEIPAGSPGAMPWTSEVKPITLEVQWTQERPRVNASMQYNLTTLTHGIDACVPGPHIEEGYLEIRTVGQNVTAVGFVAPLECELDPTVCASPAAGTSSSANGGRAAENYAGADGGDAPGLGASVGLGAALTLAWGLRRRR